MIDWKGILAQLRVEYVETGPNVHRGWIAVRCPLCGADDPSQHLVINLAGRGWKCWRNPRHSGRDPVRLVATLGRISFDHARTLLGPDYALVPDDLVGLVRSKLMPAVVQVPAQPLQRPAHFKAFWPELPSSRRFVEYLERRGFLRSQIVAMTTDYGLYYCSRGRDQGRIIFMLERQGRLLGWTGRTIYKTERLRYLSTGSLAGLLWADQLKVCGADTIVLCEGPFDALKICELGRHRGIVATCFFTSAPTAAQIDQLYELLPRFPFRIIALDRTAASATLQTANRLSPLGVQIRWLLPKYKDPGELDMPGLLALVEN